MNFVLLLFALGSARLYAQEGTQNTGNELQELSSHPELNLNDDKTLILDQDSKPKPATSTSRDINSTSTANSKKSTTTDKKKEDPFSFNFLYFIIQKFKFSDIVDEESN